jgi:hypothetical protein
MRNRILSKAVPAWEFCSFCGSQKCLPLVRQFRSFDSHRILVSCSFSSEKSYSPSRLMCCQETAEPLATASRNASRMKSARNLVPFDPVTRRWHRGIRIVSSLRYRIAGLDSMQKLLSGFLSVAEGHFLDPRYAGWDRP